MITRKESVHDIIDLINKTKQKSKPEFAEVVDVSDKGIKIKIDGQEAMNTYYNSLSRVNVGDRVFIYYCSGTILVIGKLLY